MRARGTQQATKQSPVLVAEGENESIHSAPRVSEDQGEGDSVGGGGARSLGRSPRQRREGAQSERGRAVQETRGEEVPAEGTGTARAPRQEAWVRSSRTSRKLGVGTAGDGGLGAGAMAAVARLAS